MLKFPFDRYISDRKKHSNDKNLIPTRTSSFKLVEQANTYIFIIKLYLNMVSIHIHIKYALPSSRVLHLNPTINKVYTKNYGALIYFYLIKYTLSFQKNIINEHNII